MNGNERSPIDLLFRPVRQHKGGADPCCDGCASGGDCAKGKMVDVREVREEGQGHPALIALHHKIVADTERIVRTAFQRHIPKDYDEYVQHFTIDLSNLPAGGTQVVMPRELVMGIWIENQALIQSKIGVWTGTFQGTGPPLFEVANGHFKALPVNPAEQIKCVYLAVTQGSGFAPGSYVRGMLMNRIVGPMQGLS